MNHQGPLWNVHCVVTVVLGKQLNFKSAVVRSTIFLVVTSPIPQFGEQGVIKIYFRYYYYYYHSHSDDRNRYRYR